jgi:beta-glucanase (GH16 family)
MSRPRTGPAAALATLATLGLLVTGVSTPAASQAAGAEQAADAEPASAARVVPGRGVTWLLPPLAQQGVHEAPAGSARLAGVVRFTPARPGRQVVIQRRVAGGPWRSVLVKRQNRAGAVTFIAASRVAREPYIYRGVARRAPSQPTAIARPMDSAAWRLQFSDEFGGTSLDPSKWDYRLLRTATAKRTRSVSATQAVAVRGGTLRLMVRQDPGRRNRFLNGHVGTQDGRFAFTYGVAAARIKFQRGQGQHGAFWMKPTFGQTLPGRPGESGAEIDTAEYFGSGYSNGGLGSVVYNYGVLTPQGEPRRLGAVWPGATSQLAPGDDWWRRFHVFSVQWTPTQYVFRVDGRPFWRTTQGVSHIEEYLILSLLTSDYELPRLDRSKLPSRAYVDWVRVWQR